MKLVALLIPSMLALLSACSGGTENPLVAPPVVVNLSPPRLERQGEAVIKVRVLGMSSATLVERLRPIEDLTSPDRKLLVSVDSAVASISIEPPTNWSLIDFALHPSGQVTLVLASDTELRLQRRSFDGSVLSDATLSDPEAPTDPFIGDITQINNSQSLVPKGTRDAARVSPMGEDVLLAFRSGRNAVIAERFTYSDARFERRWRTLVEPGVPIFPVRLTGGVFDPFGSLDNRWHLELDVDGQARTAIAVRVGGTELAAGHSQYFGEPNDPTLLDGAIVTLLDANGQRVRAIEVNTQVLSETQVVRWAGDEVLLAGRAFTVRRDDGTGWDAFVARIPSGSSAAQIQTLDFDRGDIIFDVMPLADGRIVLAGSAGYVQNPTGGSISEGAEPLLALFNITSGSIERIDVTSGPRQNQLRSLVISLDRLFVGGLQNGPGTHSADADLSLLTCDGFVREITLP